MIAYNYPLGGVFLSMLYFFLFFIWIWILFTVFVDIFRSHDLSGWAKALWTIFVIILPFLGVLRLPDRPRAERCRSARFKRPASKSRRSTPTSARLPGARVATSRPSSPSWPT